MQNRRIGVVLNASAGASSEERLRHHITGLLGAEAELRLYPVAGAALRSGASQALQDGCEVVVAAGGDGTVSSVASLLVDRGIALGVLPVGTLNHFARDLGIPMDLEGAARVILDGHAEAVDVGELNGRFFLNNSSLGLYPSIVRRREHSEKTGSSRLLAFAAAVFFVLRRYPFLDARLRVDGNEIERRSPFFFIGNNHYEVEGLRLGQRARLDEGLLSLYTANRTGRIGLLRIAVAALARRLRLNHEFEILTAHDISISTRRRRVAVALDGEVAHMTPPLRYSIKPGALRVLAPA